MALRKRNYQNIMFRKTLLSKETTESLKRYKKHKNFCCRLYKKERKNYFHTLDANKITDNKNMQPLLPEERKFANKITHNKKITSYLVIL